jgi:glycolate oxidase iron-sulfur subunit
MQTNFTLAQLADPETARSEHILRKCVHCGFCTATCPTYQLLGDELDSPRGRIYLIKQVLEGAPASARTRLHLDRCLTCRACETTCPSGVQYARLLDIGRAAVAGQAPRPPLDGLARAALRATLSRVGQLVPARPPRTGRPRRMVALAGCVQPALLPNINAATARVLDRLGIELIEPAAAGCCGALRHHLDDPKGARAAARRNIDAWWPEIEAGAEAVVVTASGCGTEVKDYGHLLADDPAYAAKAARVGALAKDVAEVVSGEGERLRNLLRPAAESMRVAFHSPCSLQHGQRVRNVVEPLLVAAGFVLTPVADAHLCCGSAGTYSLLQPKLSRRLRRDKLDHLLAGNPSIIASANVGCIAHLRGGSRVPVRHWIEIVDERLAVGDKDN